MTVEEMEKLWEQHESEAHHFERVKEKLASRPDVHAFVMLDRLLPRDGIGYQPDMVGSAEHDEIWLNVDVQEVAHEITEGQVMDLIRCGIRYDGDVESLAMFV